MAMRGRGLDVVCDREIDETKKAAANEARGRRRVTPGSCVIHLCQHETPHRIKPTAYYRRCTPAFT